VAGLVREGSALAGLASGDVAWRWDVALSFAGAQRPYVEELAAVLKAHGVRCFYDADEQVYLWGKHLAEELPAIYAEQAAVVVVFVSKEHAARDWTNLERRVALSRAARERREYLLPARFDDTALPGLLSDMVAVDLRNRSPEQFAGMVLDKLNMLGIGDAEGGSASSPIALAAERPPPGAVLVSEAVPQRLGVHPAIVVQGASEDEPPAYIEREIDSGDGGLRGRLAEAARRGGFLLVVGGSSVGKTRSAYEAVRAVLPDWWLVHPADPGEVAALRDRPPSRTVLWLDEIQRYLDGQQGLTAGVMRALLNARDPVVIVATMWADTYTGYTVLPEPGEVDRYGRERELLDLARVIRISPDFTEAETARANAAAAAGDLRLQVALATSGYGLTQILAAAPLLVARWEDAKTAAPYAWAVLTAALDMARLGVRTPLSTELLSAAAADYCTGQQQANAPGDWLEQALEYATRKLHGAAAPLSPVSAGMTKIAGYTVADYLLQHCVRLRRTDTIPPSTWDGLLDQIQDPGDARRLASSAVCRLLYRYAIPLYHRAIDAGDKDAAWPLADLLVRCGALDELRAWADDGNKHAAERLAEVLAEHGDLDELRARAKAGDTHALHRLIDLLAERGDVYELGAWADAGDEHAAERLATVLAERGDLDQLRARADAGDERAAERLAAVLAVRGDLDQLRIRAEAGDTDALLRLTNLLVQRGEFDIAIQILRRQADNGVDYAARRLARLLAEHGNLDELRARASIGDIVAIRLLARLLAERGELDEAIDILRVPAAAGDVSAARRLIKLLAQRGDVDELRARADAGDERAAERLATVLAERGDLDELRARAEVGDPDAAYSLANVLAQRGDLDELRGRADAGDNTAANRLAHVLVQRQDIDGLRARVRAGEMPASWALLDLLFKSGNLDEAIKMLPALARVHSDAAAMLANLLAQRGDLDELRARTEAGDQYAARRLADVLAQRGDLDELRDRAISGDTHAAELTADLLARRSTRKDAARLRRFGLNVDGSIASGPGR